MIGPLGGPWLAIAAAICAVLAFRRAPLPARADVAIAAALTLAAAVARLAFGLWLPLHVNGQGPLWVQGALDPGVLAGSYGPGYFELLGWVTGFATTPDVAVFAANALLSAASPGLLFATARLIGVERVAALAAAAVLAADPVLVRTAASESYFAPLIASVLAAQSMLAAGVRAQLRGDRAAAALALLGAGLFAAVAARVHPSGYLPLALAPLLLAGSPQPERWAIRARRIVVAAAAIGAVVTVTSVAVVLNALRSPFAGQAIGDPPAGAWQVAGLGALLAVAVHRMARPAWLPLLGVASATAMLATRVNFQQHPLWALSYDRLFWPGILLGASALFPRRLRHPAWGIAAAAVVTAVVLRVALLALRPPTTEQLEYRFLRQQLSVMPDCTVAAVDRAGRRLWTIPSFLSPGASGQRAVQNAADLAAAPGSCLLYIRGSICSSDDARGLCEAIERDASLERIAAATFPAVPSYDGLPYDRDPVETVVFGVHGHRPGVSDGVAITPAFAQSVYARLTPLREEDSCRVAGVATSRFRLNVTLQDQSGAEHPIELSVQPRAAAAGAGPWTIVASPDAQRRCGPTLATLQRVLAEIGAPSLDEGIDHTQPAPP